MKNSNEDCFNPAFSHIYVERAVKNHPRAKRILSAFQNAQIIEIGHYKDVFCRSRQSYALQHKAQKLILAQKQGNLLYKGAPVCQSFGNRHFYYASCMMNCIYDCEYCYLKGMYPSGNLVVFVNLEDIFSEAGRLLAKHPLYLCVSYDADLPALEAVAGYVREWIAFAQKQEALKIEIRTKSATLPRLTAQRFASRVIFAFTLSPQTVIDACEHGTPSLARRIACAADALRQGYCVRLCFDPMLYCADWKKRYTDMLKQVFSRIPAEKLLDVSVGTFRVSQDYLKKMRKNQPHSAVIQFPFQNVKGVYQYPEALSLQMEQFLVTKLKEWLPEEKIFLWREDYA